MTSTEPVRPPTFPRSFRAAALALAAACVLGVSRPAVARADGPTAADVETARELYRQGLERRDQGDVDGAREKLAAAWALVRTPIIGLELCKVHASGGRPVEAREVCLGVARIPPSAEETPRSAEARREASRIADEVKARIASVRVVVTGTSADDPATIRIDGVEVPAAAAGEPRSVDPGAHDVSAQVRGGPESRARVELRDGQNIQVNLQVVPPAEPPPPRPGPRDGSAPRGKSVLVPVGFGVGGVGLAVGLVAGGVALSSKGALACGVHDVCPPSEHDTLDRANAAATVSTVGFVVAGVGLATALVGYAVSPTSKASPPPQEARRRPWLELGVGGVRGGF